MGVARGKLFDCITDGALACQVYDEQFRGRILEFIRDGAPRGLNFRLVSTRQNDVAPVLARPRAISKPMPVLAPVTRQSGL
jgi:hypothetical protein